MRTESASVPLSVRIEYEWSRGSQSQQKGRCARLWPLRLHARKRHARLLTKSARAKTNVVLISFPTRYCVWSTSDLLFESSFFFSLSVPRYSSAIQIIVRPLESIAETRSQPPTARDADIALNSLRTREACVVHFKGPRVGRGVIVGKVVGVGLLVGVGVTVGLIVGVALGVVVPAGVGLPVTIGVVCPPPSFGPFL
jgi:hypothetical protein